MISAAPSALDPRWGRSAAHNEASCLGSKRPVRWLTSDLLFHPQNCSGFSPPKINHGWVRYPYHKQEPEDVNARPPVLLHCLSMLRLPATSTPHPQCSKEGEGWWGGDDLENWAT
uniref:Uncharacterized protein n=1 Tax=Knipowitschia caucasica TaxID=637954 RepID=A0AAV2J908_KNICA